MHTLLISPHNDDESLFCSYTLLREQPLVVVVTDSYIQPLRGDFGCDADTRWKETVAACKILGCPVIRLGLRDDSLTQEVLTEALRKFEGFDTVYAPAIQGGNAQHDLIGRVAKIIFPSVSQYTTYTKHALWTKGDIEVIPTEAEKALKAQALNCYKSQIALRSTFPHFQAVIGKSEWLSKNSS